MLEPLSDAVREANIGCRRGVIGNAEAKAKALKATSTEAKSDLLSGEHCCRAILKHEEGVPRQVH